MKLIAGFAALVAATPAVTDCNAGNGGAAAMAMTIDSADVQQAPVGWALAGGVYSKTVAASTTNTAMAAGNNLLMTHQISSGGCKKERVGGVDVCTKIGHVITFTCSYPMKNQDIATDTPFKVSGSDTEKTATNTGSLKYKLEVDNTSFTIGSTVQATITPVTSGLVHATIESCTVKNTGENKSVTLIGDGMKRECKLGVDVTTAQGTGNLGFTWSSFKWSTEKAVGGGDSPVENQEVSCNISLSKDQPTAEAQVPTSCPA